MYEIAYDKYTSQQRLDLKLVVEKLNNGEMTLDDINLNHFSRAQSVVRVDKQLYI